MQSGPYNIEQAVRRTGTFWIVLQFTNCDNEKTASCQSGITAVTSISTRARSSISAATCTALIAG